MRNHSEAELAAIMGLPMSPAKTVACSQFEFFTWGATERRWRNVPRTDASREKFITLFGKTP